MVLEPRSALNQTYQKREKWWLDYVY